ncbi:hypothetical protein [Dyella sp.]|uniref:hypothetical protein n=1 Tax=Dyella sp. TaxID=1869338 RepID=UPI00283E8246|nr:hypothetical protein [Dyella sp.]MDR3445743.1 hypothetical protein [Dyella sp.]
MHEISPGLYPSLSNEAYHHGPGTSKSGLDILHKSAEKFHWLKTANPDGREPTDAQAFGSAYHAIVLEPEVFARTYCLALRMQDVPGAIDDRDTLVAMVAKLNESRLPKLPATGDKATLVARITETQAADVAAGRLDVVCVHSEAELAAMTPESTASVLLDVPGYESLALVLGRAFWQAANGKGSERHAQGLPFDQQPMQQVCDLLSVDFALGQAMKKAQESRRLPHDRAVAELLGAINYLAGAVIHMERQPHV